MTITPIFQLKTRKKERKKKELIFQTCSSRGSNHGTPKTTLSISSSVGPNTNSVCICVRDQRYSLELLHFLCKHSFLCLLESRTKLFYNPLVLVELVYFDIPMERQSSRESLFPRRSSMPIKI